MKFRGSCGGCVRVSYIRKGEDASLLEQEVVSPFAARLLVLHRWLQHKAGEAILKS